MYTLVQCPVAMQKKDKWNKTHSGRQQQQQQQEAIGMKSDFQFKMICGAISAIKIYSLLKYAALCSSMDGIKLLIGWNSKSGHEIICKITLSTIDSCQHAYI